MESALSSDTFEKRSIGIAAAQRIVDAAFREAETIGIRVAVSVVDESGLLKAFARQDGAALVNTQSSQDKAYTAVGFGLPSHAWYPMIKDDPALLHGVPGALGRILIFGGGIPIKVDGHLVGAVGVGGGTHEQDRQVAEAAVRALEGAPAA
jgi:glc operon protein GlcG